MHRITYISTIYFLIKITVAMDFTSPDNIALNTFAGMAISTGYSSTLNSEENIFCVQKMTSMNEFIKPEGKELPPEDFIQATLPCEIYGHYHIYKNEEKIGLMVLDDGVGSYYANKRHYLGYHDGSYVEISIFIDAPYVSKGYYSYINEEMKKKLINPFIGSYHTMKDGSRSVKPFQGIRGIVAGENIPSLRACLKNGRILADIPEMQGRWEMRLQHSIIDSNVWNNEPMWCPGCQWITQYPPNITPTKREEELIKIAKLIIDDSLSSFNSLRDDGGRILNSNKATAAITKHFHSSGLYPPVLLCEETCPPFTDATDPSHFH